MCVALDTRVWNAMKCYNTHAINDFACQLNMIIYMK